jgi:hypothetical protein
MERQCRIAQSTSFGQWLTGRDGLWRWEQKVTVGYKDQRITVEIAKGESKSLTAADFE